MAWCETSGVHFVFGLARNTRLAEEISGEMGTARLLCGLSRAQARLFRDSTWRIRECWSRSRWVVGKAEWLPAGSSSRFVVTSPPKERVEARELYEIGYCSRGDMENRIMETKVMMFADRTSTRPMHSNQVRLHLSSFAYVLMQALHHLAPAGTGMVRAQCDTIRLRLLKIAARVTVSARRVRLHCSDSHTGQTLFRTVVPPTGMIPMHC